MRVFLENNSSTLNDKTELDKFLAGCVHCSKLFSISCEDWLSKDPLLTQKFIQGSIIITLLLYFKELDIINGAVSSANSSRFDIVDSDSDPDNDNKPPSKGHSTKLRISLGTASLKGCNKKINQLHVDL